MKDLERLVDGPLSPVERALLQSAQRDVPSAASVKEAALALGLAPPLAGPATWFGSSSLAKLTATLAVVALGTAGVLHWRQADPGPSRTVRQGSAPLAAAPLAEAPVVEVESAPSPATPSERSELPSKPSRAQSLSAQVAIIDSARLALDGGDSRKALREIARYRASFPQGAFRQEAFLLELDALVANGQGPRAATLARSFLQRYPSSPHAGRVSRIAGAGAATPSP